MSVFRGIVCVLFPPLAVIDKGCGSILIVSLLTLAGWVPGVLGALFIVYNDKTHKSDNAFIISFLSTLILGFVVLTICYVLFWH